MDEEYRIGGETMKKRTGKLLSILVALVVSMVSLQAATLDVAAGSSDTVVDNSTFEKEQVYP